MKKGQKKLVVRIFIIFIFLLILFCIILSIKFSQEEEKLKGGIKYCSEESRISEICAQIYEPVCGYYDEKDCNNSSCKKTFSNSCLVCMDKDTLFYTFGEC